jgi:predicted DNA-binding transcriptional regulator AlpA
MNTTTKEKDMMKKKDVERRALSPEEAATMYGLNVGTLANLRHARRGPKFFKIGKRVVYFVEDIEAWMRQSPVLTRDSLNISAGGM